MPTPWNPYVGSPDLIWHVPPFSYLGAQGSEAVGKNHGRRGVSAGRVYQPGEVVERSWCFAIGQARLSGSYLEEWCPLCPEASDEDAQRVAPPCARPRDPGQQRLVPLGWGLLFEHDVARANLMVEYELAELPLAPVGHVDPGEEDGDSSVPATHASETGEPHLHHWLLFRTTRRVLRGEAFCIAPLSGLPSQSGEVMHRSVFDDACATTECDDLCYDDDFLSDCTESPWNCIDVPTYVHPPDVSTLVTGASRVHGIGVFAARDIHPGEIVEYVPMLPISDSEVEGTALFDYCFSSNFKPTSNDEQVLLLALGYGGMYNHDGSAPNVFPQCYPSQPFLHAWVAGNFIPEGSELFIAFRAPYRLHFQ